MIRNGLNRLVASTKPLIRKGNREKRLKYAKTHKDWNEDQREQMLCSDESKFELFGSNRRQYVRRRVGERYNNESLQPLVKHGGGSVMVWACISASDVGHIVRIDGILNAEKYRQVLIHHAIPSGKRPGGNCFIFQHDNDPKHTAHAVKSYLERKTTDRPLTVMDWPPQSPYLNIIEAVRDHLDRERHKRQPKSATELWELLKEAWYNIPDCFLKKFSTSHN